jgi:phosphatidylglycerophosphate synthase
MPYEYAKSLKSDASDEPVNTILIRPVAGVLVRWIYGTPITPNQVTVAAILIGFAAAVLFRYSGPGPAVAAGLCLTLKDIVDSADGQLARARGTSSRAGRFLDSIGDLAVNLAVFGAIAASLVESSGEPRYFILGAAGFLGTTLRISYHVFYHTSYLHLRSLYAVNRLTEEVRPEDRDGSAATLRLQKVFQMLYGWQDRWMARIDRWSLGGRTVDGDTARQWYADRTGLLFTGVLGLGSELFLLTLFSLAGALEPYLWFNVVGLNGLWCGSVGYRRWVLAPRLGTSGGAA